MLIQGGDASDVSEGTEGKRGRSESEAYKTAESGADEGGGFSDGPPMSQDEADAEKTQHLLEEQGLDADEVEALRCFRQTAPPPKVGESSTSRLPGN
jgi:hypothetical protein